MFYIAHMEPTNGIAAASKRRHNNAKTARRRHWRWRRESDDEKRISGWQRDAPWRP